MPRINVKESDLTSTIQFPNPKDDAWIKPPPNREPLVFPDQDKKIDKDDLASITLGVKAYSFAENFSMHGVRYVFGRDMGILRRWDLNFFYNFF